jgi:hypothetical protein
VLPWYDVILNFSYDKATRPKFALLLMGGSLEEKAHFWGKKCFFAPISPL